MIIKASKNNIVSLQGQKTTLNVGLDGMTFNINEKEYTRPGEYGFSEFSIIALEASSKEKFFGNIDLLEVNTTASILFTNVIPEKDDLSKLANIDIVVIDSNLINLEKLFSSLKTLYPQKLIIFKKGTEVDIKKLFTEKGFNVVEEGKSINMKIDNIDKEVEYSTDVYILEA